MDAYCNRQGLNSNSVRFVFDGNRVNQDDTPKKVANTELYPKNLASHTLAVRVQLDLEDGDEIDVMVNCPYNTCLTPYSYAQVEQSGGAC